MLKYVFRVPYYRVPVFNYDVLFFDISHTPPYFHFMILLPWIPVRTFDQSIPTVVLERESSGNKQRQPIIFTTKKIIEQYYSSSRIREHTECRHETTLTDEISIFPHQQISIDLDRSPNINHRGILYIYIYIGPCIIDHHPNMTHLVGSSHHHHHHHYVSCLYI